LAARPSCKSIDADFSIASDIGVRSAVQQSNSRAAKNSFRELVQLVHLVQASSQDILLSFFSEIMRMLRHSASMRGALRGRHGR
jgi:hypothetical protein